MRIILYTTHCPKCKILEKKLQSKKITYEINEEVNLMQQLGFTQMPMLQVEDEILDFAKAYEWANKQ